MSTRQFTVTAGEAGQTLLAVLRGRLPLRWSVLRRLVRERQVQLGGTPCTEVSRQVRAGQRIEVQVPREAEPAPRQGPTPPEIVIRYSDPHVVVVDKPAGLTTMRHPEEAAEFGARARRFLPSTLLDLVPPVLARKEGGQAHTPMRLRAVHRLDRDTSGLVVFARTEAAERHLGRQFRAHTVERRYLAVVRGRAISQRIESQLVADRGDGRRGSSSQPGAGKPAVTHVQVLEELGDYTLVECRLETGRTHQVRIHLGERGTPLCGERVYDRPLQGRPIPDHSGAPRTALHAASLGFEHPATGKHMSWSASLPADLAEWLDQLRRRAGRRGTGPSAESPSNPTLREKG